MGAEDISVHSRLTVVPSKPTPPGKVHKLSFLDHVMQKHFLSAVYYYDASSVEDRPKLLERLKESLCKALSTYPLFAGRLQKREDGLWEVKYNDAGVRIYEANCTVPMRDFLAKSSQSQLESELCRNEINPDHTITPVAVIQFTEFSCGNIAIGLSWLHAIGDPMCGTLFLKTWGETHRAAQILHAPFFHPPSLKPRATPNLEVRSRDYYTKAFFSKLEHANGGSAAAAAAQGYHTVTLVFSHESVEKLITEVGNGRCKFGPPPPFDALSALMWVAICKAQGKAGGDESRASICLEFRKIHVPPLPYGYVGNAVHFTGISCPAKELVGNDLSYAGSIINETGGLVDTEEVRSVIDVGQEMEDQGKGILANPPLLYSDGVTMANFDHFFCFDVVFDFGKPVQVAYRVQPLEGEGLIIVLPAAEGKLSRTVVVSLPKDVMARLLRDDELLRFLPELRAVDA